MLVAQLAGAGRLQLQEQGQPLLRLLLRVPEHATGGQGLPWVLGVLIHTIGGVDFQLLCLLLRVPKHATGGCWRGLCA